MTKEREALKLALDALELEDMACRYEKDPTPEHIAKTITAIREALAQPEQNQFNPDWDAMAVMVEEQQRMAKRIAELEAQQAPVAWATRMGEYAHIKWGAKRPEYPMVYEVPLYTTLPHRKPLSSVELVKIELSLRKYHDYDRYDLSLHDFARAIEAAHGIKGEA